LNPHASKESIEQIKKAGNLIAGCGKPMVFNTQTQQFEKCDYL
jgi:hypothetical protein